MPIIIRVVDWWAGRIDDPVERLRFLSGAARPGQPKYRGRRLLAFAPVVLLLFTAPAHEPSPALPTPEAIRVEATPDVWLVDKTSAFEAYSNGLRIDNRFSVTNHPRSYLAFSVIHPDDALGERRSNPAGIIFHTTESLQAPFEAEQNAKLESIGESLLDYVRRKRAYNFVIDRFGRVYRVVPESDAANHAGYSIWSDADWIYLNLNESFLAVSFETRTVPGQSDASVNPAQLHSAAMLTETLRKRYGIPARNCVTHAQVSVNPDSMRIGYHLDWASSFPFEQVGLPDNYDLPLSAITLFGLEYDSDFVRRGGARLYEEAHSAEQELVDQARAARVQASAYRRSLQRRYKKRLAIVRGETNQTEQEE
jgi:hypothetical protein